MADLYTNLPEVDGMVRVLSADVQQLSTQLNSEYSSTTQRTYSRAVFALVEAILEQHKKLLLDLAEKSVITLDSGVTDKLKEDTHYLKLQDKLKIVYKKGKDAFNSEAMLANFSSQGWSDFGNAVSIRNRITHPKTHEDCQITDDDLQTVKKAEQWFRQVNNKFVEVARKYRETHPW